MKSATLLRDRRLALLFSGQCVSSLGDAMFPIALSVYLVSRGAGAGVVAALLGSRALGSLLGILVAGAVIDRFPRARVMWVSDLVRLALVICVLWAVSRFDTALVYLLMAGMGMSTSFFIPAFRSIIPRIVSSERLQQANSFNSAILQTSSVLGPACAGALVALVSPGFVIWADAGSFAVSVATLVFLKEEPRPVLDAREGIVSSALSGVRTVRRIRWLWVFILAGMVQMACAVAPWFSYLPTVSLREYGSSAPYSMSLTAYAVGGVLGAVAAGWVTPRRPGLVVMIGPVLFSGILYCLGFGSPAALLVAVHFVAGAGLEFSGVFGMTAIHRQVPDEFMGRVMSLTLLGGSALTPLSYMLIAGVSGAFGRELVLLAGGTLAIVVLLVPLVLRDFRYLDDAQRHRPRLQNRSPVVAGGAR